MHEPPVAGRDEFHLHGGRFVVRTFIPFDIADRIHGIVDEVAEYAHELGGVHGERWHPLVGHDHEFHAAFVGRGGLTREQCRDVRVLDLSGGHTQSH